uniref:Glycoside hydrolase family 5 domain-containing protein n=1 Tax=Panagrolaimus superbus TaxID=310955 RepID=A0A914Y683_9BILA
MKQLLFSIAFFHSLIFIVSIDPPYGPLKIQGKLLTDINGTAVTLRGMSLMGSNYHPQFWNEETIRQLKCSWNINIIRAPITPKSKCCGGWFADPSQPINNPWEWKSTRDREFGRLKQVIDASVKYGIYVIIDWHIFDFGNNTLEQGREFFANVSQTWGNL